MTANIVIVDHDQISEAPITRVLERAGFVVSHVLHDPVVISVKLADLFIISPEVPQPIGLQICSLAKAGLAKHTPTVVLTRDDCTDSHVHYLRAGADDVIKEAASVDEFLARVRAHIRRAAFQRDTNTLQANGIRLDRRSRRVTRNGREIALGPTEYRILEFLMENRGRVLTRAHLIADVWSHNAAVDDRTVDVHLGRLRRAIDTCWEATPIRTVRGIGYIFDAEI